MLVIEIEEVVLGVVDLQAEGWMGGIDAELRGLSNKSVCTRQQGIDPTIQELVQLYAILLVQDTANCRQQTTDKQRGDERSQAKAFEAIFFSAAPLSLL